MRRMDFAFVQSEFEKRGCTLLSVPSDYQNARSDLFYLCNKHKDRGPIRTQWTRFYNIGQGCPYCMGDKHRDRLTVPFEEVAEEFSRRGYNLLSTTYRRNDQKLKYTCVKHPQETQVVTYNKLKLGSGCHYCKLDGKSGENHWNWKGGVSSLYDILRTTISEWKAQSMQKCEYKCAVTGCKDFDIHHLYGFDLIIQETLEELGYTLDKYLNIQKMSQKDLESVKELFLVIHARQPLGVCLQKDVHREFHSKYGTGGNTPEQFYEFMKLKGCEVNV